jgi:hypothetical protein
MQLLEIERGPWREGRFSKDDSEPEEGCAAISGVLDRRRAPMRFQLYKQASYTTDTESSLFLWSENSGMQLIAIRLPEHCKDRHMLGVRSNRLGPE